MTKPSPKPAPVVTATLRDVLAQLAQTPRTEASSTAKAIRRINAGKV